MSIPQSQSHHQDPVALYRFLAGVVRNRTAFPCTVREHTENTGGCQCPEVVLQSIWTDQSFADGLQAEDGRRLKVIHPGIWNLGDGPDFLRAVVEFDGEKHSGDIEIHRLPNMWFQHRHHEDSAYANVILHVVLDTTTRQPPGSPDNRCGVPLPPCLVLRSFLPKNTLEAIETIAVEDYPYARKLRPGGCAAHLAAMPDHAVRTLLRTAGLNRFQEKVRGCLELLVSTSPEQSAYTLMMDAMGYRKNRTPFRLLAQTCPLSQLTLLETPLDRFAALLGTAGLLKDPTRTPKAPFKEHRELLLELWDRWWPQGREPIQAEWNRTGVRPANRPTARLWAAWRLIESWSLRPLATWWRAAEQAESPKDLIRKLRMLFNPEETECWHNRRIAICGKDSGHLGRSRTLDVLCNVALPMLAARARQKGDEELEKRMENTFLAMPRLQRNRTFSEMGHRLLMPPGRLNCVLKGAAEQQGLIAVHRDYCDPQGGDCSQCPLANRKHIQTLCSEQRTGS
jgi:hypothetical protein